MLADKDRIFRNLYGSHDWGLKGARDGWQVGLGAGVDHTQIFLALFARTTDASFVVEINISLDSSQRVLVEFSWPISHHR